MVTSSCAKVVPGGGLALGVFGDFGPLYLAMEEFFGEAGRSLIEHFRLDGFPIGLAKLLEPAKLSGSGSS